MSGLGRTTSHTQNSQTLGMAYTVLFVSLLYQSLKIKDVNRLLLLICETASLAIEDAGIGKDRIDGVMFAPPGFTMGMMMTPYYFTEYLKLKPTYANVVDYGGATAMVLRAAAAIATGQCETLLCLTGDAFDPKNFMEMMQKFQFSPAFHRLNERPKLSSR